MFRKIIAAACLIAALGFAVPASADGHRHRHWVPHRHYGGYTYYGHDDSAAFFAGGLLLGGLLGYMAAPPRVYLPPRQPVLGNCRVIYGTGYYYGRLAEFSGTGCYDAYGNLYAMPGSERFLRYLE